MTRDVGKKTWRDIKLEKPPSDQAGLYHRESPGANLSQSQEASNHTQQRSQSGIGSHGMEKPGTEQAEETQVIGSSTSAMSLQTQGGGAQSTLAPGTILFDLNAVPEEEAV